MKTCVLCDRSLNMEEFYKNKRNSTGYNTRCKDCERAIKKVYRDKVKDENLEILNQISDDGLPIEKVCARCHITKPKQDFQRSMQSHDLLYSYCKSCTSDFRKERRRINGEDWTRNRHLKHLFNITLVEYNDILCGQGGGCAVCGRTMSLSGRHLHVDHDHMTGKVRGILCDLCNMSLGAAEESVERLQKLSTYLSSRDGVTGNYMSKVVGVEG